MKKIFVTFLMGALLILGISACSGKENANADVVVFSQQGCPHCEHAQSFLNGELQRIVPDTSIQDYDIRANRHNYELFMHAVRTYGLNGKSIGTPLIIINNQVLIGWNEETKNKVVELVKQKKLTQQNKGE